MLTPDATLAVSGSTFVGDAQGRGYEIGGAVSDGQTVIYTGACGGGSMRWTITGTVDGKYRPKS